MKIVTLKESLEQKDTQRIRYAAHTMIGSSSYLGITRIAVTCAEIEQQSKAGMLASVDRLLTKLEREFVRFWKHFRLDGLKLDLAASTPNNSALTYF